MKIFCYFPEEQAVRALTDQLNAVRHDVTRVESIAAPVPARSVFLLGPAATLERTCDLVKQRRALAVESETILVAGPWESSADIRRVLGSGADQYLIFPCTPPQLETLLLPLESLTAQRRPGAGDPRLESRIEKAHRYDALASLTAALTHDFSNLLTAIRGNADLALMSPSLDPALRHSLEQIAKAAEHASSLNSQLTAYTHRPSSSAGQLLNLTQLIRHMHDLIRVSVPEGVRVEYRLGGGLPMMAADPAQVRQLILALAVNAGEAVSPGSGVVRLRTGAESAGDNSWIWLEVEDNGPGIPADNLERLFDPCFSTKGEEKGLGLAAASAIAGKWGARIEVQCPPAGGTLFRVCFPATAALESAGPSMLHLRRGSGTLLLIDDDEAVRAAVQRLLGKVGYNILGASSGEQGVEMFRGMAALVDAVILDLCLSGIEGAELIRSLRETRADVRILVWSGFGHEEIRRRLGGVADIHILTRPKDPGELAAALDKMLSGPGTEAQQAS